MNALRRRGKRWLVATTALAFLLVAETGRSFHNGGIGECEGCHHVKARGTNIYNLIGSDQSSTCLRCHEKRTGAPAEEHHVSTAVADMPRGVPPSGLSPGGDFGWLKKGFPQEPGEVHGHNIIAADFGYFNSSNGTAPGGNHPSGSLHCTSCHDPHGRYRRNVGGAITLEGPSIKASGSYSNSPDPAPDIPVGVFRLLGGIGYRPKSLDASQAFRKDPPAAVSPTSYNRSEGESQTRVAYGSGMSEWCASCHVDMHGSRMSHPSGNDVKLGQRIAGNYNAYIRSGDLSGNKARSYLSLVPFEEGTADYTILSAHARSDDAYLEGPGPNANVSCLSCHRAHASGWPHSLRFNIAAVFITVADGGSVRYPDAARDPELARGRSADEIRRVYYDRPPQLFSTSQRTLCGKCHAKD